MTTPIIEGFVINKVKKKGVKDDYKVIGEVRDWEQLRTNTYGYKDVPVTFYSNSGQCYEIKDINRTRVENLPELLRRSCYAIMKEAENDKLFDGGVVLVCCEHDGRIEQDLLEECPMCDNSFILNPEDDMNNHGEFDELCAEMDIKEQELGWNDLLIELDPQCNMSLYDVLMDAENFSDLCKECALEQVKSIDRESAKHIIQEVVNDK
jgi:hypothetical protein